MTFLCLNLYLLELGPTLIVLTVSRSKTGLHFKDTTKILTNCLPRVNALKTFQSRILLVYYKENAKIIYKDKVQGSEKSIKLALNVDLQTLKLTTAIATKRFMLYSFPIKLLLDGALPSINIFSLKCHKDCLEQF